MREEFHVLFSVTQCTPLQSCCRKLMRSIASITLHAALMKWNCVRIYVYATGAYGTMAFDNPNDVYG